MSSVDSYVEKTLSLLGTERAAEQEELVSELGRISNDEAARRGMSLLSVSLDEVSTGLYGRFHCTFTSQTSNAALPNHKFTVGDIGGVRRQANSSHPVTHLATGVITKVTPFKLVISFDVDVKEAIEKDEAEAGHGGASSDERSALRLDRVVDEVTYNRLKIGLDQLRSHASSSPAANLISVLFQHNAPLASSTTLPWKPFNKGMNDSQRKAIDYALRSNDVAIIHGPPGTGKTTTVVEFIRQAVQQGLRVLACAPSNVAVDNMVERLAVPRGKSRPNIVRVGHPARLLPSVLDHCLDARIAGDHGSSIVSDVKKEMSDMLKAIDKSRNKTDKRRMRGEVKLLRKEIRTREEQVVKDIILNSHVVLTTCIGAANDKVLCDIDGFDVVVIDEAAQSLEAACWIPLLKGKRAVLAGDHCQLPPTIKSHSAAADGLGVTLLDRIVPLYPQVVNMLDIQYRMHADISNWSSAAFYHGKLLADESVANRDMREVPSVKKMLLSHEHSDADVDIPPVLLLIDTAGADMEELQDGTSLSRCNMGEADIVYSHVKSLLKLGIQEEDIAIISPYNEQVELLRRMLGTEHPAIEIKSVDGFQGREKEAVVMSLVRSNKKREVGFLKEDRRINVAITRARVHVAIVCDSVTVSSHPFLKSTIEYFECNGTVIPALDYNGTFDDGAGPRAAEFAKPTAGVTNVGGKSVVPDGPKLPSSNVRRGDKPFKASMTEEEKRQIRNIMRAKLTLFKESGEIEGCTEAGDGVWVNFPPIISGFSRMVVHEICEEVSLLHASHGEGSERYVSVARPASLMTARAKRLMKDQKTKHNIPASFLSDDVVSGTVASLSVLSIPDDDEEEEVKGMAGGAVTTSLTDDPNPIKIANNNPMPPLPPAGVIVDTSSNALLAQLAKEREARKTAKSESVAATPREAAVDDEPKGGKTKSKKKKGEGSLKGKGDGSVIVKGKADALGDDLDDDALLDGLIALQNQCFKKGCKEKNVKLYGSNCPHCKQLYCLKHMQAETHGCDMAAREAGRESWLKSHATENHKKLKDWQRNSLSNQLNKKISDATDSRTSAEAKEKDKKKKK